MPQTPDERRAQFEALARRRQQMLDAERHMNEKRAEEDAKRSARQEQESVAEQQAAARRSGEREAWRQEQHSKHEEELEAARTAAEEEARRKAKAEQEAQEQQERDRRMHDLHDRAVRQKVASRKLQAEHAEEETVGHVDDQLERNIRDLHRVLERTLEHLTQDRTKKIAVLHDEALRMEKSMTQAFEVEKKALERSENPRSGGELLQLIAKHKRGLMALRDRTEASRNGIEREYVRLKDEAGAQAAQKEARLRSLCDQRRREARTRHENMDKWIDSHRG